MLQNVVLMICDANGVTLAAVICKRIVPRPDSDDIASGLQYSEYASHDDEMIERAPILDCETFDRDAKDKEFEKIGSFDPRYLAACSLIWIVIKGCIGSNNNLISRSSSSTRSLMYAVLTLQLKRSCLEITALPPSSVPLKKD